ncbi:MAG TPA: hypothetical protein VJU58_06160 [Microbacterium sp.]|nr:hypothetical protein [Microbacterium sp.]
MTEMPALERYVRREVELASGIVCAVGLEHRPEVDPEPAVIAAAVKAWCGSACEEVDPVDFAERFAAWVVGFTAVALDGGAARYWFIEVWGKQDDAAFYQIIQRPPWRTGGFHP